MTNNPTDSDTTVLSKKTNEQKEPGTVLKKCTLCLLDKDSTDFSVRNGRIRKRCIECCIVSEKRCVGCEVVKPVSDFFRLKDGYKPRCKVCTIKQNAAYIKDETKEKRKEYMRKYMYDSYHKKKDDSFCPGFVNLN